MKLSPFYYLTLLLAAMFIGCAAVHPSQTSETGNAISRIDARAQSIGDNTQRLRPLTQSSGLPILDAVGTDASRIRQDVVEAKHANDQAAKDYAEMAQKFDREYHKLGNTVERVVVRFAWTIGIAAALALVLRVVALNAGGPWGAAASFVSTGIFGVLSGGLSLIQSVFDNLWFRKFKPQGETQ